MLFLTAIFNRKEKPMINPVGMSNNYIIPVSGPSKVTPISTNNTVDSSAKVKPIECQTCKARKYQDGSNENNVSFKAPGHIDPSDSYARVMGHEQEHVANARKKTIGGDADLLSASVSLQIGICPECGRTYVSGGTTTTQIAYNETNPHEKGQKTIEGSFLSGQNIDYSA